MTPRSSGSSRRRGDVAGVVSRIHVENFMCHGNLTIELIDNVNFITGQNGSGKSAILTALCVAFGIRARGTQRASSLKDFIKNGCSYALVIVEIKNEGPDAFRPDVFGKTIIIERKITASSGTTSLKDEQGRKVAGKKEDLYDIIDHFNIDVENPCVVMSQDKSREFLHSGNEKDKFKFFYKATLLQQVAELLDTNNKNIQACQVYLKANEEAFRPFEHELAKLDEEIKRAEKVDEMAQEVTTLRKKLAWSHVYDADRKIEAGTSFLQTLQDRVPKCQDRIDKNLRALSEKRDAHARKTATVTDLIARTEQVKEIQDQLYRELTEVARAKAGLDEKLQGKMRQLEGKRAKKRSLQAHARSMEESFAQSTQAEEHEIDESLKALQEEIDQLKNESRSLQEMESQKNLQLNEILEDNSAISKEVEDKRARVSDVQGYLRRLQNQQSNKLSAFGGDNVLRLMRKIEEHQRSFSRPPLGPIGAHVALAGGDDAWGLAVEVAVGKLLNSFVVSDHKDMITLRRLARDCQYGGLQIVIYDFEHPGLQLPTHMLPDSSLVTVLSVLRTENSTIRNVLIDQGGVERQILVQDYTEGSRVVFERRQPNVKEAYTRDGLRMFSRAGSETTLPKDRNIRGGRLEADVDQKIRQTERELLQLKEDLKRSESEKRRTEHSENELRRKLNTIRGEVSEKQRVIGRRELRLRDLNRQAEQAAAAAMPNTDELEHEILDVEAEERKLERVIEGLRAELQEVEAKHRVAKSKHDDHCDSTKDDADALKSAADTLQSLDEEANLAAEAVEHFRTIMSKKVLPDVRKQEDVLKELKRAREESFRMASQICSEEEVKSLGVTGTTEKLDTEIQRLQSRVNNEKRNITPIENLLRDKLKVEKKICKKKSLHIQLKHKIETMSRIYGKRRTLFEQNSAYLKRQMLWQFNNHLRKKGFSGQLKIDYEAKTLKLEILMPQDASNTAVKDTRALSGGERSFSTLCFALALHEMTEAPFRAMDEFDVFMDAVSRKISLDTLVDFALEQGSQWIFITPHDISMVKNHPKLKKQQMSAPRP